MMKSNRHLPELLALVGLLLFTALLGILYRETQHIVVVDINGIAYRYRTHQQTANGVLREMGLALRAEDRVVLPDDAAMLEGEPIRVTLARHALVLHDGSADELRIIARSVSDVLSRAMVSVGQHDTVIMNDRPVDLHDALEQLVVPEGATLRTIRAALEEPIRISVERAVLIHMTDGSLPSSFYTTANTVGEALYDQGVLVYEGDKVNPPLNALLSPEMRIVIERSKPVTLESGGQTRLVRTRLETVGELLDQELLSTSAKDYIVPDRHTPIVSDLAIRVVYVRDEYEIQDEYTPYRTLWRADPTLPLDTRAEEPGQEGIIRRRIRTRYENNVPVYQTEEEVWVARESRDHIYKYGTDIVMHPLDTGSGTIYYWRKLRVLITSYSPAEAGTPRDAPWYGLTRMGLKATKGIVAVDPNVIPLGSWIYVPGYGKAYAGDTGGMIIGYHIDLCYDDWNYINWYEYGTIYLMEPVPYNVNPILPGQGPPADVDEW